MILRKISDNSIAVSLFRYFFRWHPQIEHRVKYIYHNSQTNRLTNRFWEKIKICFRYSFLGRLTETEQKTSGVLEDSRMYKYLINFYKRWKNNATRYLRTSLTIMLTKDTKKGLYFSPVMIISIIIITAITVNVLLSIALQNQIGLWGLIIRGLLLFGAIPGLFCKADWPTVKKSSVFLRKMGMD